MREGQVPPALVAAMAAAIAACNGKAVRVQSVRPVAAPPQPSAWAQAGRWRLMMGRERALWRAGWGRR